ncbi:replicative DNA helicase [Clostridium magnum]|uniref:Replicative DNA helicase n=1 Tax=Clostridium magnum DSM 2767 TaxID=1121326 RepID=A0A162QJS0_9CLOT|nr:replicative DNA helicase [Clostridium magnum]KZL88613.1 replicative DNA helicase [Clostridium magnum DSM 2767]SHI15055.1 replicative DNA helicase [Clostridium magnum DSM 2767]
MDMDRIYNFNAETNVIGSILMESDSICEVIGFLNPEDFYNLKHKILYKNLKKMYEENLTVDIVTLSEKLGESLKEVGGISYITDILNSIINTVNIKKYGEIVKEKANNRALLKIFNSAIGRLQSGDASQEEVINYAQDSLLSIKASETKEDGEIEKILHDFMDTLQSRYEKGGEVHGVKSGYKTLDRMLGGFSKEDLIILAARPSMGKTAMALNLLLNTTFKGQAKTAFFNLEMGTKQIIDRAVALRTKIPLDNIKNASLSEEQWYQISKEASILANSSMKIYDKIFTLNGIAAECRKLKIKEGLDVVIIDYLQLIESGERTENRNQDISKITRRLKLMAKEIDINIIVLSQLSRAPETRSDHRPMLSDLRESGSIEQDSDVVMLLYRDDYYHKDSESKGIMECIVAKNRNGEVGTSRLKWKPEIQSIV